MCWQEGQQTDISFKDLFTGDNPDPEEIAESEDSCLTLNTSLDGWWSSMEWLPSWFSLMLFDDIFSFWKRRTKINSISDDFWDDDDKVSCFSIQKLCTHSWELEAEESFYFSTFLIRKSLWFLHSALIVRFWSLNFDRKIVEFS